MTDRIAARGCLALPLLVLLASCAGADGNVQGPTQPQSTSGPCRVKSFFLLGFRSVPAAMTVANTGAACTFTLINPALNAVVNAALLTGPARQGTADAQLIGGNRQVAVSYLPRPGFTGTDQFDVTLEPNAVGVTVHVTVVPPSANPP